MREGSIGILAIQETHLTDEFTEQFESLFSNCLKLFYSPNPNTRNMRGVALVINRKLINIDDTMVQTVVPGRAIAVSILWQNDQKINVLAIYTPTPPWRNQRVLENNSSKGRQECH